MLFLELFTSNGHSHSDLYNIHPTICAQLTGTPHIFCLYGHTGHNHNKCNHIGSEPTCNFCNTACKYMAIGHRQQTKRQRRIVLLLTYIPGRVKKDQTRFSAKAQSICHSSFPICCIVYLRVNLYLTQMRPFIFQYIFIYNIFSYIYNVQQVQLLTEFQLYPKQYVTTKQCCVEHKYSKL